MFPAMRYSLPAWSRLIRVFRAGPYSTRVMHLQMAIVTDESQPSKFFHDAAHS
jgi:hypothetical protein